MGGCASTPLGGLRPDALAPPRRLWFVDLQQAHRCRHTSSVGTRVPPVCVTTATAIESRGKRWLPALPDAAASLPVTYWLVSGSGSGLPAFCFGLRFEGCRLGPPRFALLRIMISDVR